MKKETQTRKVEDKKERSEEKKKTTQGAAPALNICVYNDLQHE